MNITIKEDCIACGACEELCPAVFKIFGEVAMVFGDADSEEKRKCVREAADTCPVMAIVVEE